MKKILFLFVFVMIFVSVLPSTFAAVKEHKEQGENFSLTYPIYVDEAKNQTVEKKINDDILHRVKQCSDRLTVKKLDSETLPIAWVNFSYQIGSETENFLSLLFFDGFYYKQAAHGMYYASGVVYDKHTGEQIPLEKFVTVSQKNLKKLTKKKKIFIGAANHEQRIEKDLILLGDVETIPKNFYINQRGKIFLMFQPYELLPYAAGISKIDVTQFAKK